MLFAALGLCAGNFFRRSASGARTAPLGFHGGSGAAPPGPCRRSARLSDRWLRRPRSRLPQLGTDPSQEPVAETRHPPQGGTGAILTSRPHQPVRLRQRGQTQATFAHRRRTSVGPYSGSSSLKTRGQPLPRWDRAKLCRLHPSTPARGLADARSARARRARPIGWCGRRKGLEADRAHGSRLRSVRPGTGAHAPMLVAQAVLRDGACGGGRQAWLVRLVRGSGVRPPQRQRPAARDCRRAGLVMLEHPCRAWWTRCLCSRSGGAYRQTPSALAQSGLTGASMSMAGARGALLPQGCPG